MSEFVFKELPYDLSNQAGLALVGKYLKRININGLVDPTFSVRSGNSQQRHPEELPRSAASGQELV